VNKTQQRSRKERTKKIRKKEEQTSWTFQQRSCLSWHRVWLRRARRWKWKELQEKRPYNKSRLGTEGTTATSPLVKRMRNESGWAEEVDMLQTVLRLRSKERKKKKRLGTQSFTRKNERKGAT
jgi:hypothetical protein